MHETADTGPEPRIALVTGANGFVGRVLRRYLTERGWTVRAGIYGEQPIDANELDCDITRRDYVQRLVEWAGPVTHVFHLAALTFVPDAVRVPASTIAINVEGTINLVEVLRENRFKGRFLYIGSSGAYGEPASMPITEDHPLVPLNPYDISKAAADQYCEFASAAGYMDIVRLRPFNHSGPGQKPQFVFPAFARALARIEAGFDPPVLKVGNLDKARDFMHVDDVAAAYEALALTAAPGGVYNVCSSKGRTVREGLDILLGMTEAEVRVEVDEALLRPADADQVVGSNAKLVRDTGWEPACSFEDMLHDLLEHWRGCCQHETAGNQTG